MKIDNNKYDFNLLKDNIKIWALELGLQQTGITDINLASENTHFKTWLEKNYQANMHYLENNFEKRMHPEKLVPNTCRIICCSLHYSPPENSSKNIIAAYARGRDYHKILRKRLQKLAQKIKIECADLEYRVFCDSAPVLEKSLAAKCGLGWIGKNNLLINPKHGSYFFLGEIYINLPLPIDKPIKKLCGNCHRCIDACPTKALVEPNNLNANRCISYLTIENKDEIPDELHKFIDNKVFGCDECQKSCPWNRFAKYTNDSELQAFDHFKNLQLNEAATWDEKAFLKKTIGSPIRRSGFKCWQRNVKIALGNKR